MDNNEDKRFDEKDERGSFDSQKQQLKSRIKEQTVDRAKENIKEKAQEKLKETIRNVTQRGNGATGTEGASTVSTTGTTGAAAETAGSTAGATGAAAETAGAAAETAGAAAGTAGAAAETAGAAAGTTGAAAGTAGAAAGTAGAAAGTAGAAAGTAGTAGAAAGATGAAAGTAGAAAGATGAAAGATGAAAGATGAAAGTAAGAAVGVTITFVLVIMLVILIILAVIGLVAALMFLPSFTLSTVKEWIESAINVTMQWLGGGDSAKFKQEEIAHVLDNATYIRRMGYNLYNDGYIYKKLDQMEVEAKAAKKKKEVDKETGLEKVKLGEITDSDVYVPEEGIYEDESGNVKALSYENSPLLMYTWINGYTYFIDEMPGIWFKIGKTLGKIGEATGNFFKWVGETVGLYNPTEEDKNKANGAIKFPGMLKIKDESRTDFVEKFANRAPKVTIDLDTYTMRTESKDFFGNNKSNVNYTYEIQGWIGRYGLPLNLLIAMHKATNAPDMLVELIKGTKYENGKYEKTKLNIELVEIHRSRSYRIRIT